MRDPAYAEKLELMWTLNRSLTNTMIVEDTEAIFTIVVPKPLMDQIVVSIAALRGSR